MLNFFQNKQKLYEVRIYIRHEHRRYTPWILLIVIIYSTILNSFLPFLIYSPLTLFMRKMFSYVVLNNKLPILAFSENEIIISHKNIELPFKEIHLEINQIKSIYFDNSFWYSTIGIISKNNSLINLNFSRELEQQYREIKLYFNSTESLNKLKIISGPDKILKIGLTVSFVVFSVYNLSPIVIGHF
ncbi:hypothetical protein EHR01_06525 [Leptospira mtsangambouensis]|uniref:PH domain-containing protein n=1 Tax=Leptospira mtsangambouensis TaxID=2484912 RepID=A0ABY2P4L1_9LEPT|nr:hypothetical protein [Leptospira mtsangambouensis]TGM82430.1 hypothetical protein EHR01_06525 [Leptospira mtsangambouensis]